MIHSFGGGEKGKIGAKGQDSEGDLQIINQIRKVVDLEIPLEIKFLNKTYMVLDVGLAKHILYKYEALRTSIQKEQMTQLLWQDSAEILKISEGFNMINNKKNKKETTFHGTVEKYK